MNESPFGKVIHTYTTKEAISDGTLVQVDSKISKEAGIKFPVILTRTAWEKYVEVPKDFEHCQDLQGRLWDILFMFALRAKNIDGDSLNFTFHCMLPNRGDWTRNEKRIDTMPFHREVTLHSRIKAFDFDDPSPAIFVMIPGED